MRLPLKMTIRILALVLLASLAAGATAADKPAGMLLRDMVLDKEPPDTGRRSDEPAAVIMDFWVGDAVASVMSATTGDASIYFSTGGGIIGGARSDDVRKAAQAFARATLAQRAKLTTVKEHPYPDQGKVRFYLRTRSATQMVEVDENELTSGTSEFAPLFTAGQAVITQLRKMTGK